MSGPCHPYNATTPHIYGTPCDCGDWWTSLVDFNNAHTICYSLVLLYIIWGSSLIIGLVNFVRLAYCIVMFVWQRRHHGRAILRVGALQVLIGFSAAAACLVASSVIKLVDMQHTRLGYHIELTVVFMAAISISFLSFVRSHWSYMHITLATGLVAAAHRQGAVRTVRTVLIADAIMFGAFVFLSTPVALAMGGDNYTGAYALLISSMCAFWFHALICLPLFFFYGALVITIDQGMLMKNGRDPAMLDLRDRLQSLRRRQFSTLFGAVVYTVGVNVTEATLLATWAYTWPACHLLIGIGLTGYSFKYWSPSQENLGIARQLALPATPSDIRGDAYLLNSPASGGKAPHVANGFLNNKNHNSKLGVPASPPQRSAARLSGKHPASPPPPPGSQHQHPPAGFTHPFHAGGARVAVISLPLSPSAARHATGFAAIELINATNRTDREQHQHRAMAVTSPSSEQHTQRVVPVGLAPPHGASQHQLFTRTATTRNLGISPISGPATGPPTSHSPIPFHMPPTTVDDDDNMTARSVRTLDDGTTVPMYPNSSANSSAPDLLRVITVGGLPNNNGTTAMMMMVTNASVPSLPLPERAPSVQSIISPTAVAWQ